MSGVSGGGGVKVFESSDQSITAGGLLTLAHGLGVMPRFLDSYLVCQSAEYGWAAGDVLAAGRHFQTHNTSPRGQSIWADASNVYVRFSSDSNTYSVLDKATGGGGPITNASWKLRVRVVK